MTENAFDPLRSMRTLVRHDVEFVVIGGLAARLQGSPSVTNDVDVCYKRSPENLERLAAALRQLGASLRGVDADAPFRLDAGTLAAGDHFTFSTKAGALDCIGTPAGVAGYDELEAGAESYEIEGLTVSVASVDDLIHMKEAAGRPKDLIEVEVLSALRDDAAERRQH